MAFFIADNMAKYLHKQDESRRKVVTFSTDIQGLVPQFLDKIMVSHSSLQWGDAGYIISRNNDELTISEPLTGSKTGKTIVFRNIDGSVSDPYTVSDIAYPNDLSYPSETSYPREEGNGYVIAYPNIESYPSDTAYPTEAGNDYIIAVYGAPSWVDANTFYTILDSVTAQEFLVVSTKPSGDAVEIECVNYDESIYT